MNTKRILFFSICTAAAAAAVAAGCLLKSGGKTEKSDSTERLVKLVRVGGESEKSEGVTYPGRVRPVRHAELFFRVTGPVVERNLKYGQTVEKGDVLMRVDPRDYEREVDRLTQELEMQKVQNSLANIEYNRQVRLLESKATSQSAFDSAAAKKRASDAQVRMLEVSLRIAQDKLRDTVLSAPFHGSVTELKIEQYEIAHANVPVVVLDDLREIEIRISIPGGNLPDASIHDAKQYLGRSFDVTFPGRGNRVFRASIYEFKPVASEETETYEATLRMKVPDDFLILPGMSAEVHGIPHFTDSAPGKMLLPYSAVFMRDGKSCVWVCPPETRKLELRQVSAERAEGGDSLVVTSGVKAGEYVVAAGGDWLTADSRVALMNPEAGHDEHH